jgi:amino-acid N-acetyltransferase
MVESLEGEANDNDLESVFAFTYVPEFFARLGFEEVERGELPLKAWKDCLRCPKFHNCDEIAVLKHLKEQSIFHPALNNSLSTDLIQLPTVNHATYR